MSSGCRSLAAAGLLVCALDAGALAQSGSEVAVGGGLQASPDTGDLIQLPSGPIVALRATRWQNDRWGLTGNVFTNVVDGGNPLDGPPGEVIYKAPTVYVQVLLRYRVRRTGGVDFYVGIGPTFISSRDTRQRHRRPPLAMFHPYAFEVLSSWELTDRLNLRVGVGTVPPFLVHPFGLLAWRF